MDAAMSLPTPRKLLRKFKRFLKGDPNRFLNDARGVIHVGANTGQERADYDRRGLAVTWIEPIPHIYDELEQNLKPYPRQKAIKALVTDRVGQEYEFHVANNEGASSSILELKDHRSVWPNVEYTETIKLHGTTLTELVDEESIDMQEFDTLILDTQGSELMVLEGAEPIIDRFEYIQTEVADFESYANCCQLDEIEDFMQRHGFEEYSRRVFTLRSVEGNYYEMTYRKAA